MKRKQNLQKPFVSKRFLCDCCGKEKAGKKHKMCDENWNLQRGCYECDDCFSNRLKADLSTSQA